MTNEEIKEAVRDQLATSVKLAEQQFQHLRLQLRRLDEGDFDQAFNRGSVPHIPRFKENEGLVLETTGVIRTSKVEEPE